VHKAGPICRDYHRQMNHTNFGRWANSHLLPYLPQTSISIMDSASYYCMQEEKPPTRYSLKGDMINWLRYKGIWIDETVHKVDLYKLEEFNKARKKKFWVDTKLTAFGHTVLHFPPYMCDLSVTELAWAKVKHVKWTVLSETYICRGYKLCWRHCKFSRERIWEGYVELSGK
jgi:hypothetical protein